MSFISNMEDIRMRARQKIEQGAITENYPLNEVLATEIVCTLCYRFHYFMATGIHSGAVAEEFFEHAETTTIIWPVTVCKETMHVYSVQQMVH
jgi:bacterioferritin